MYSLRLSLYKFEASTFAGEEVLGSFKRLEGNPIQCQYLAIIHCNIKGHPCRIVPLDTRQDGSHIVCGAPAVLENIETKLASSIYVRVEHLADELDAWRLVGILLLEVHHQAECTILKGSVGGADDDGIPATSSDNGTNDIESQSLEGLFGHTKS